VFPRDTEARYRDALLGEISAHRWEWRPETVYLGGGTPSSMETEDLATLMALVPGRPWAEATLEAAPGTVTAEKARAWVACGIDRISLGVQSFVDREIRRTGRKHSAAMVAREIEVLREAGIRSINIDLIAGLAAQTEAGWRESLDWIERLGPEHVSVYMLEVDEDSRLGKEMLLGGVRYGAGDTPGEDATAEFYEMAVERLAALGIARYEISNFARPGFESRHNVKYWRMEPYVGFGADAHSFDGRERWANAESVEEYVDGNGHGQAGRPTLHEHLFLGLRMMSGVKLDEDEWTRFAEPIQRFVDDGLVQTEDGRLRLTDRGVLLSNEVFEVFV
jgi:oxygen-independent coproporphyrinogen-3 oxidase